jgi:hypothetical protein
VQGFATRSQVLIVTHQKRTMETAEMMYGVSMGADGTSKVICQRLDRAADPTSDAAEHDQPVVPVADTRSVDVPAAEPVH